MSAEKRGARFSAKAYYTFGKALEDVDYQGGGLPAVQNSNRIDLERARTSADRTHSFVFSRASGGSTTSANAKPVVKALLERLDDLGDRHAAERRAADDHRRAWIATSTASPTIAPTSSAIPSSTAAAARGADRAVVQTPPSPTPPLAPRPPRPEHC